VPPSGDGRRAPRPVDPPPIAPRPRRRRPWGEWATGYLFVLPAVLVIGVFGLFPIGYALFMSVHRWRVRRGAFVGFDHFERTLGDPTGFVVFLGGVLLVALGHLLWTAATGGRGRVLARALALLGALTFVAAGVAVVLGFGMMQATGDARFIAGLQRTFYYGAISVPVQVFLALVVAALLFQKVRGRSVYRMLFFLPYVTPAVAGAAVFRAMFSPREERLANAFLGAIGVDPQRWLFEPRPILQLLFGDLAARFGFEISGFWAGPSLALLVIILFGVWTYVGYNAVIFLAGLGGIPQQLYEAAEMDGASGPQRFWAITVPLLAPVTFYLSVLGFIGTFQAFTHLYVMRETAVRGAVDTASLVIFDTFYALNDFGLAAAQSLVLFAVILAVTLLQGRLFGRRSLRA
jgi:ABC-type sugar transport system permease subunit